MKRLACCVVVGIVATLLTGVWLAERRFAVDLGLSQLSLTNALTGSSSATLTTAGWVVFAGGYALLAYGFSASASAVKNGLQTRNTKRAPCVRHPSAFRIATRRMPRKGP
jgi:hypothetical protein